MFEIWIWTLTAIAAISFGTTISLIFVVKDMEAEYAKLLEEARNPNRPFDWAIDTNLGEQ